MRKGSLALRREWSIRPSSSAPLGYRKPKVREYETRSRFVSRRRGGTRIRGRISLVERAGASVKGPTRVGTSRTGETFDAQQGGGRLPIFSGRPAPLPGRTAGGRAFARRSRAAGALRKARMMAATSALSDYEAERLRDRSSPVCGELFRGHGGAGSVGEGGQASDQGELRRKMKENGRGIARGPVPLTRRSLGGLAQLTSAASSAARSPQRGVRARVGRPARRQTPSSMPRDWGRVGKIRRSLPA